MKTAWVFDIDGVLNNPTNKTNIKPELLEIMAQKLKQKDVLAFVTGRSTNWVLQHVFQALKPYLENASLLELDNIYISGEFGSTSLTFENGNVIPTVEKDYSVPQEICQKAGDLMKSEFKSTMHPNPTVTFFSSEIEDNIPFDEFKKAQKNVAARLQELLINAPVGNDFVVHEDFMGTNIIHKGIDKGHAVDRFLNWLEEKNLSVQEYIAFGDATSDLDIGRVLSQKSLPFRFIFVGDPKILEGRNLGFTTILTHKKYDEGTLEYLKNSNE